MIITIISAVYLHPPVFSLALVQDHHNVKIPFRTASAVCVSMFRAQKVSPTVFEPFFGQPPLEP